MLEELMRKQRGRDAQMEELIDKVAALEPGGSANDKLVS
jgi:hypothetical protein